MDRSLSIVAVAVSALALFISGWQGVETYKINRLSIRPFIQLDSSAYGPVDWGGSQSPPGAYIENSGNGTAIIHGLYVETTKPVPSSVAVAKLSIAAVRPGGSFPLIVTAARATYNADDLSSVFDDAAVDLCYCDIGGFQCWKQKTYLVTRAGPRDKHQVSSCEGMNESHWNGFSGAIDEFERLFARRVSER
jgi:hypothetical protein